MIRSIFLFFIVLSSLLLSAQDFSLYQKKYFVNGKDTLKYRLLMPLHFKAGQKYPILFFLHGSGERGSDNEKQLAHGGDLFIRNDLREKFPCFVVFPQCPENDKWANYRLTDSAGTKSFSLIPGEASRPMQLLKGLIQQLRGRYKIDQKRIYVGGLSMGGMGTFDITSRNPDLFAAAFPICGAADITTARRLKGISWWIFHGAKDDVVPPASSIAMAAALKLQKAKVKFTLYPDANHNSWDSAFGEQDLLPWLFSQHK